MTEWIVQESEKTVRVRDLDPELDVIPSSLIAVCVSLCAGCFYCITSLSLHTAQAPSSQTFVLVKENTQ